MSRYGYGDESELREQHNEYRGRYAFEQRNNRSSSGEGQKHMAQQLISGDFVGKAVKVEIGRKKNKPMVRITMQVGEGEHKGKSFDYEGKLDDDNIKYTKRAMVAVGWKGQKSSTFADDVKAAALDVPFTVEVAEWQPPEPDRDIVRWSTIKRLGGAAPLEKFDANDLAKADEWFAAAGDVGERSESSGAANSDLPF